VDIVCEFTPYFCGIPGSVSIPVLMFILIRSSTAASPMHSVSYRAGTFTPPAAFPTESTSLASLPQTGQHSICAAVTSSSQNCCCCCCAPAERTPEVQTPHCVVVVQTAHGAAHNGTPHNLRRQQQGPLFSPPPTPCTPLARLMHAVSQCRSVSQSGRHARTGRGLFNQTATRHPCTGSKRV
jgi:hypothetical protein